MNKQEFLSAIQTNHTEAIRQLYKEVAPPIKRWILANNGRTEDAEDVLSEVLLSMIEKLQAGGENMTESVNGYIYGACKLKWLQILRNDKKHSQKEVTNTIVRELYDEYILPEDTTRQERNALISRYFHQIGEKCQELLSYYLSGFSHKEIMEKTQGTSENQIRKAVFDCKEKLIEKIKKDARYSELI